MKVKRKEPPQTAVVTMRLRKDVVARVDAAAKKAGTSRQRLVEAILGKALNDPGFVVEVQ